MSKKIDVKIGSKEQVVWERVAKAAKEHLEQMASERMVQEEVLLLAQRKVEEEKARMSKK